MNKKSESHLSLKKETILKLSSKARDAAEPMGNARPVIFSEWCPPTTIITH
jgi:hypothetical protein